MLSNINDLCSPKPYATHAPLSQSLTTNFAAVAHHHLPPERCKDTLIFCDPGKDDIAMLAQALSCPEQMNVRGIIAGVGNVELQHTLNNALLACETFGRADIPVYAGAPQPIGKDPEDIEYAKGAHGFTGLGCWRGKKPLITSQVENSITWAAQQIKAACQPLVLTVTGGHTDLALVFRHLEATTSTEGLAKICQNLVVSMMGGVFDHETHANMSPYAEFNFGFDPIASGEVMGFCERFGIPVFLAPLDLTHTTLIDAKLVRGLRLARNPASNFVATLLADVGPWDVTRFGLDENNKPRMAAHDVHAVSCLLHPELYSGRWHCLDVVTHGERQGMTTVVDSPRRGRKQNVFVLEMEPCHMDMFHNRFMECLGRFAHVQGLSQEQRALDSRVNFDLWRV